MVPEAKRLGPKPETQVEPREPLDHTGRLSLEFQQWLRGGRSYARITDARRQTSELLGRRVEPGTADAKLVDEVVEQGVVRAARDIIREKLDIGVEEVFDAVLDLCQRQPTLATRDSVQKLDQEQSDSAVVVGCERPD